jgi:predicted nucleic acid-binding protein
LTLNAEVHGEPPETAVRNAAALAQKYDRPLVTGDRDFRRVANLELEWLDR